MNAPPYVSKTFSKRKQQGNVSGLGARVFNCSVSKSQGNVLFYPDTTGKLAEGLIDRSQSGVLQTVQQVAESHETGSQVINCNRTESCVLG